MPAVHAHRALLVAAIALGALVAGCAGGASGHGCEPPPTDAREQTIEANLEGATAPFRILWLGDTLLADGAQPRLDEHGYGWPFERLTPLPQADAVIANAEGPITTRTEVYDRKQPWTYNAQPAAAEALAEAGVTAAGLANNHAMDRGPGGLVDTLRHLEAAGVATFGAGETRTEALTPLLLESPFGTVGVVGLGQGYGARKTASDSQPGTLFAEPCTIREAATVAREAGADWLVAFVHWGSNYAPVQHSQRAQAKLFVEAGYDLVIGHGPHVQQPVEILEGVPIVYSLGNFVFGTPGRFDAEFPGYGLLVTSLLGPSGFEAIELRCIRTNNDAVRYQPQPCSAAEATSILGALHPGIEVRDGIGTLAIR